MKTDKNKVYDKAEPKKEETETPNKALLIVGTIFVVGGILALIILIARILGKKPKPNVAVTKKVIKKKVNKGKLMCKTQENKIENVLLNLGAGGNKNNISFFSRGPDKNGISYCTMAYTTFNHIYYADYVTNGIKLRIFRKGIVRSLSTSYLRWHRYFKDFHFNNETNN